MRAKPHKLLFCREGVVVLWIGHQVAECFESAQPGARGWCVLSMAGFENVLPCSFFLFPRAEISESGAAQRPGI